MASEEPYKLPAVKGMNNRLPDFRHKRGDDSFVKNAVNVDVTAVGTLKRRKGTDRIIFGEDTHSLWSSGDITLFMDHDTLKRIDRNTLQPSVVSGGMTPGRGLTYAMRPDGNVLLSDGVKTLLYTPDGDLDYAVPARPTSPADLSYSGAGAMPAGRYQVVFVIENSLGIESGSSFPAVIDIPANSTLEINNLPAVVGTTRVYMTHPNGDTFYEVPAMATYPFLPAYGRRCAGLLLDRMPSGHIIRTNNGRTFVASGSALYYSEPYSLLYNPMKGFVPFSAPITIAEPCGDGIYVSADQTYWFGGDIAQAAMSPVLPYKALAGTACAIENSTDIWWMSDRGAVRGNEDGKVKNLQEADVAVNPGQAGAALFRDQDGMRQLIATVFGTRQSVAVASTWMEAEITRKETVL